MGGWLGSALAWLLSIAPSGVRTLIRNLNFVVRSLWNWVDSMVDNLGRLASRAYNRAVSLGFRISNLAREVWATVRFIYNTFVPNWARWALDSAIHWARRTINRIVDDIFGFVGRVQRAFNRALSDIWNWAIKTRNWLIDRIRNTINTLRNQILKAIAHVLNGPVTLARWLIAAIVEELWRYVLRNDDRIFRWVRDRTIGFTVFAARRLESLIARLL